jgi:hypothetical protein
MYEKPPVDSNIDVACITTIPYLEDGCHYAYYLALILTNSLALPVNEPACIVYALSEEMYAGSSSNKPLSVTPVYLEDGRDELKLDWEPSNRDDSDAQEPAVLDNLLTAKSIIMRIRTATESNNMIQTIIQCKANNVQQLPYNLIKASLKLNLGNCRKKDGLLYVRDQIFILDNKVLQASIIS